MQVFGNVYGYLTVIARDSSLQIIDRVNARGPMCGVG